MNIEEYLKEKAGLVNDALSRLVPGGGSSPRRVHEAVRYSLFAGGKRIRPVLVLAAAEAVGGDPAAAINTACAFECVHTYSLIHDDLPAMDDDDLRRGKPTCHKAFDEATAILAGDALLTIAFQFVADSPAELATPERLLSVTRELAKGAGSFGMIGGQMADIESEGKEATLPEVENIHIRKTGALILASVRSGAIIGGGDDAALEAISRYGTSAGLAFQIADDLLDVEGTVEETGKAVGADVKLGKATYPALLGIVESRKRAAELTERAISSIEGFGAEADPLREIARFITARKK